MNKKSVAIDTNSLVYLTQAFNIGYNPQEDKDLFRRPQRVAMFQIFIYQICNLCIVPTVQAESKKDNQNRIIAVHLHEILPHDVNKQELNQLLKRYNNHHDMKDCKILAEAEVSGCDCLLTFDNKLIANLKDKAGVKIMFPSLFWHDNAPPKNSPLYLRPAWDNPKSQESWYIWK